MILVFFYPTTNLWQPILAVWVEVITFLKMTSLECYYIASDYTVLSDCTTVCMTVQLTNRSVPHIEDLEVQEEEENCEQLLLTYLLLCTAILYD